MSHSRGRDGRDGVDGRDGRDADSELIAAEIRRAVALLPPAKDGAPGKDFDPDEMIAAVKAAVDAIPRPKDGRDGRDAVVDTAMIQRFVQAAVAQIRIPKDGERGPRGPKGEDGPIGPRGPIPEHEWDGTRLRFKQSDGAWGEWVDLRGERGPRGRDGAGGGIIVQHGGGTSNSYFPSGWA